MSKPRKQYYSKYKLWTTGVNQNDYIREAKAQGKTRTEGIKAYLGKVYDNNEYAITHGLPDHNGEIFSLTREQFIENIYDNAKDNVNRQWGVKRQVKNMQLGRSYMTAEEMGQRNAEQTLRNMGEWGALKKRLGRGDYTVETVGSKKDRTYRYTGANGNSFVIRFNAEYKSGNGEVYDIGLETMDGTQWGGAELPW